MRWLHQHDVGGAYVYHKVSWDNSGLPLFEQTHWQEWQVYVPQVMRVLMAAFRCVGIAPLEAATGDFAVSATSTICSSSSSSTANSQQVKWGYLLRLPQINPQWAAALAAYQGKRQDWVEVKAGAPPSSAAAATVAVAVEEQRIQQCRGAIELCRVLVAAARITVICNNPSCENLGGVSEAAAACKACVSCGC
jgi:hypothetical protein